MFLDLDLYDARGKALETIAWTNRPSDKSNTFSSNHINIQKKKVMNTRQPCKNLKSNLNSGKYNGKRTCMK